MNDIFREVDEQYRQEQLLQFWHDNARVIIAVLVISIACAVGLGLHQSHQLAKRQQETYRLAHAVGDAATQKPDIALANLSQVAGSLTGKRENVAKFALAHATLDAGDQAGAIRIYDEIAANGSATHAERSLAEIISVGLQVSDGDPAQLSQRLDKLAEDDSPWRFSAREWQILLAMRQGDMAKAHDIATRLAGDSGAPDGVHARAQQLAALTGEGLPPSAMPVAEQPGMEMPEAK